MLWHMSDGATASALPRPRCLPAHPLLFLPGNPHPALRGSALASLPEGVQLRVTLGQREPGEGPSGSRGSPVSSGGPGRGEGRGPGVLAVPVLTWGEGGPLQPLLAGALLPCPPTPRTNTRAVRCSHCIQQILEAVLHCHQMGVVHRDLKVSPHPAVCPASVVCPCMSCKRRAGRGSGSTSPRAKAHTWCVHMGVCTHPSQRPQAPGPRGHLSKLSL